MKKKVLFLWIIMILFLVTSCTNGYIIVYCCHNYSPTISPEDANSSCHGHRLSLRNLQIYDRNIPDEFSDILDIMFGNDRELLSVEERWGAFFIECHQMHFSRPHKYLQWAIEYQDGDGITRIFTFNNRQNFHFHVTRHIGDMISQHYQYYFYDVYASEFATIGIFFPDSAGIPMAESYLNPAPYAQINDPLWRHQAEAFRSGLETTTGAIPLTLITPSNVFEHMPIYLSTVIPVYRYCLCLERTGGEPCPYKSINDMITEMNRFTDYSMNIRVRLRFTGCNECKEIEWVYLQGVPALAVSSHDGFQEQVMETFQ